VVGPLEITGGDDAAQSSGWCFVRSGAAIDVCLDGKIYGARDNLITALDEYWAPDRIRRQCLFLLGGNPAIDTTKFGHPALRVAKPIMLALVDAVIVWSQHASPIFVYP
jgi:hypothetical protein